VRADAILVMTSSSSRPGSPPLLQALFDLTPAEAAIASKIGAGLTLEQIAIAEGRSMATVRNQLKSVLAKTGCARQAELTRMLALLVPPGM
jgi:DNA-binding CsgD family transcriptional regulator